MHGPCGSARKSSPCMQNRRCTKHFPKMFVASTTIDEEWYPIYRRRDNGRTARRVGIELDNRRIFFVPPGSGEQYYLRLLLNVIKGPKSYEELRKINGCDHKTFRDACYALGLLDDDKEYVDAIIEASNWGMTSYLTQLFAMLLLSNSMSRPESVWQATWHLLSEDILHAERTMLDNPEFDLSDDELKNRYLKKLENFLKGCGRNFQDFPTMPTPVYKEEEVDINSTCNIKQGSLLANLIVKAKLIIWDEAPMMHRYCFEALDRTLRDILRFKDASNLERPFGGKTVVLGGDFRQILPVIPKVDGNEKVEIPDDLLIKDFVDPISAIVESTYPDFINYCNDIGYLQQRAILAPTLDMVESINEYMISLNHSPEKSYLSSDIICSCDQTYSALEHVHTPEFLNTIKCSGVSNHALTLKVGVHQSAGLCNGTRLIITKLGNQVIETKVLSGHIAGQKVFIPRIILTPSDARIPFKYQRRQFPITVSLSHVRLFLKKSVFTHGQLYVALSGVTTRKGLKILVYDDDGQITTEATNVVFKEVFPNLF
ncbi:uncharacterized protein [Nicotiana tomentosiformis]|uniref:uncharacterized protein n=1 Tax=Nicotiana tomentosiformis TaxID=4098 RepID=UPI00388CC358